MDQRLFNAACSGDIDALHQLLAENPFILGDYARITLHENPLNVATKAKRVYFVQEIMKLKPELAKEISQDGLRPLDIASAYGYVEIVTALLAASEPSICRLPGRDGRTAVHHAAINGSIEIIDQLLAACSDAIEDVTAFGETVLHLAVKYFKYEACRHLMEWLEKLGMTNLVNSKDREGNTALHYAVSRKQLEMVELILNKNSITGDMIEVNAANKNGLTAIDVLDISIESSSDVQLIRRILQNAGGQGTPEVRIVSEIQSSEAAEAVGRTGGEQSQNAQVSDKKREVWSWMDYYRYQRGRDPPSTALNALLVVAALFVTVTFQAGINPPTYTFQDMDRTNYLITWKTIWNSTTSWNQSSRIFVDVNSNSERPGAMVSLTVFLAANSLALSTSLSIIDYIREGLPFQREIRISGFAMMFAYGWSVGWTKPTGKTKDIVLTLALITPLIIRTIPDVLAHVWKSKRDKRDHSSTEPAS